MQNCPAEIWTQIIAFACTDSGFTGRSISLVSRSFRTASRPFKYQSIALTRSKYIRAFRSIVSNLPPDEKRVRYLYVQCPNIFLDVSDDEADEDYDENLATVSDESDQSMNSASGSNDSNYEGSLTGEEQQELLDDAMSLTHIRSRSLSRGPAPEEDDGSAAFDREMQEGDAVVLDAFRALLDDISSSLLILSVNWSSFEPLLIEELLLPLPYLVELHLRRAFTSQDEMDPESDEPATVLFPLLRRLYISGYIDQRPDPFGRSIGKVAPVLTHLRMPIYHISLLPTESPRLPDSVQKVIVEVPSNGQGLADRQVIPQMLFGQDNLDSSVDMYTNPFSSAWGLESRDPNSDWFSNNTPPTFGALPSMANIPYSMTFNFTMFDSSILNCSVSGTNSTTYFYVASNSTSTTVSRRNGEVYAVIDWQGHPTIQAHETLGRQRTSQWLRLSNDRRRVISFYPTVSLCYVGLTFHVDVAQCQSEDEIIPGSHVLHGDDTSAMSSELARITRVNSSVTLQITIPAFNSGFFEKSVLATILFLSGRNID
ncbi:hypothetical protein BDZ97DRAFT_1922780 [Flammula alnicola]|nr:hypothetical protein BDZ97DRAFT_1922780 [Flammula alnicola]